MNLSQQDVADACGLTQAMISYIEAGKKMPWGGSLDKLRDYTGLPADAFLRWQRFLAEEPNFLRKYSPSEKAKAAQHR